MQGSLETQSKSAQVTMDFRHSQVRKYLQIPQEKTFFGGGGTGI
jgi:hypothetical protein